MIDTKIINVSKCQLLKTEPENYYMRTALQNTYGV